MGPLHRTKLLLVIECNKNEIQSDDYHRNVLPQEVVQGAGTWSRLGVDKIIPSVQTNRVLSEPPEFFFVAQHAAVVGVADVIGVSQPLHIVFVFT